MIIGSEHTGISNEIISYCDHSVSIEYNIDQRNPLNTVDSLNVSVATGIVMSKLKLNN